MNRPYEEVTLVFDKELLDKFLELCEENCTAMGIVVEELMKKSVKDNKFPITLTVYTPNEETLAAMKECEDPSIVRKVYNSFEELLGDLDSD